VVFECRGKLSRLGDERDNEGKRTGKQEWKEMGTGRFQVREAAAVTLVVVVVRMYYCSYLFEENFCLNYLFFKTSSFSFFESQSFLSFRAHP